MAKIGILGTGFVARAIETGLVRARHEVVLGSRDPEKTRPPRGAKIASRPDAGRYGDMWSWDRGSGSASYAVVVDRNAARVRPFPPATAG